VEPKKNKALPWILAGGGVVVVGVVVVLLFVFGVFGGGSGSTSSPDSVAQAVADALNSKDSAKAAAVSCDSKTSPTDNADLQMLKSYQITASVSGKASVSGNSATARIHLNFKEQGHTVDIDGVLTMQQQSGKWCVPSTGFQPDQNSMKVDGQSVGSMGNLGSGGGSGSGSSGSDTGGMGTGDMGTPGSTGLPGGG
jgi:hypothetical protein